MASLPDAAGPSLLVSPIDHQIIFQIWRKIHFLADFKGTLDHVFDTFCGSMKCAQFFIPFLELES